MSSSLAPINARVGAVVALRTALVWNDEVMGDVVNETPARVTLGTGNHLPRSGGWIFPTMLVLGLAVMFVAVLFLGDFEDWFRALLPIPIWVAGAIMKVKRRSPGPTFTVANVGLPEEFAIVQPGNRGYLLTLGPRMRGTICIDGKEQSVEDFVRAGGIEAGGFHATPISGRDWGVIDLDESGEQKLFFQFVPIDDHKPFLTRKMIYAGAGGYFVSTLTWTIIFAVRSSSIGESAARGMGISLAPLVLALIVVMIVRSDGGMQAAILFSFILHACLLFWTYKLFDPSDDPFQYPGPKSLLGNYLVTRIEDAPEEKPPEPVAAVKASDQSAAPKSPEKPNNAATKGAEGAAGGSGEKERARDKDAVTDKPTAPKIALTDDKNSKAIKDIIDRNLDLGLDKFKGLKGDTTTPGSLGWGTGTGTGVGPGNGTGTTKGSNNKGTGGNGFSDQDIARTKGPISTGTVRPGGDCVGSNCTGNKPKEVKLAIAGPEGDLGGLTAEEIGKVVRDRARVFRACYQHELNHSPDLGGKVVVKFKIDGSGVVQSASIGGGSTLQNAAVHSCITGNVMRLKFPAKGGTANVNYPFVFSQGG